jgi:hypothetical protein
MKTLFWIWVIISSTVTVIVIGKEIAWEMRDYVRPDAVSVSKNLEYAIAGRNTETVFQHTFSTELTNDVDLFRITDSNVGITPELAVNVGGMSTIIAKHSDYENDSASREAFLILCCAAADWRTGFRNEPFDEWVLDIVLGSEITPFQHDGITAVAKKTPAALSIVIFAH